MMEGRGIAAPAQGRGDNTGGKTNGAVPAPFVFPLTSVMPPRAFDPGLTRHLGVLAVVVPLSLSAQSYFQQQVDYRINVRLDDVKHELHADEQFDYHNNSPNALDTIWIHLWPNAYKDRSTALCEQLDSHNDFKLHFATPGQRGFIDSLDFKAPEAHMHGMLKSMTWGYDPHNIDIAWIKLPQPLATGQRITISTPFRVKIPSARFSRLGHIGQAYYITQWFPKPAVFDRDGWHAMPYLTQGEFYSEFGSFDVSITLPENYVVGATGEQQNPAEIAFMDSLAALPPSFTLSDAGDVFPPSSAQMKTIRFKQDRVHDFAWFADKRFLVQKSSVQLKRSGHIVNSWALFTPSNGLLWQKATEYINESVRLYSEWIGDYPYSSCTAIDGGSAAGGGMEYPMITIINEAEDAFDLDVVIAHEVGHNWFYGMLASNERDHPWMDEGINSFYEQRYVETRYPGRRMMDLQGIPMGFLTRGQGITYRQQNELQYRFNARRNWDSPLSSTSTRFTFLDYGTTVYSKGALVMDHLFANVGEQRMQRFMKSYFEQWKFKHPSPTDMGAAFERESDKPLVWLFNGLIPTEVKYDIRAVSLDRRVWEGAVERWNVGHRANGPYFTPFPVTGYSGPDSLGTVWHWNHGNGNKGRLEYGGLPWDSTDHTRIDDAARALDIDRRNNEVRAHGLLKRRKLPEVKFLAGLEREDRKSIFWTPAIARNVHDGFMAGLVLHNTTFPNQRFEWVAAPLYGTRSERLAGGARFMWHHDRLRSDLLRNIHVGVSGFAASLWSVGDVEQWYQRAVPSIQCDVRSKPNAAQTDVRYRSVVIWNNAQGTYFNGEEAVRVDERSDDVFHDVRLHHERKTGLHPFHLRLTSLNHAAFNRLAIDATWSAIYDKHRHCVTFRGFGGLFLNKNDALMRREMGWRMHWGSSDLLYDHLFVERQYVGQNTAQQFAKDQGGFKTPTANGTSDTWIAAVNMEADFPFRLPLALFASYGAAPFTTITQVGKSTDWRGYWEAGIGVRLVRDVVEMWVPLAYSKGIKDEVEITRDMDFTERIRFVFALERMDPTIALRRAPH